MSFVCVFALCRVFFRVCSCPCVSLCAVPCPCVRGFVCVRVRGGFVGGGIVGEGVKAHTNNKRTPLLFRAVLCSPTILLITSFII